MTKYQITEALRRDDLSMRSRELDVWSTIEETRDFGHEPSVLLVCNTVVSEDEAPQQCLEVYEGGYDPGDVRGYVYVPLAFGPVQESAL